MCRHTAADCCCVENNSRFNVMGKTLFNPGQWQKDTLVTVECPNTFETTNYCNKYQAAQCLQQVQLPQTAAAVPLPLPLHAAKALLRQNPFAR
jgi:hypothetical protein